MSNLGAFVFTRQFIATMFDFKFIYFLFTVFLQFNKTEDLNGTTRLIEHKAPTTRTFSS